MILNHITHPNECSFFQSIVLAGTPTFGTVDSCELFAVLCLEIR